MDTKLKKIFSYLKELFPDAQTELRYSTPFQFLVAVMLSAQATDVQVNKVTEKLFLKIKTPADLVRLGFKDFQKTISSINYYKTKAKNIWKTSQILVKNCTKSSKIAQNCGIPNTLDELMELPGIGVKTAKLIAHVLYDKPYIAVDTHVQRVANRL